MAVLVGDSTTSATRCALRGGSAWSPPSSRWSHS